MDSKKVVAVRIRDRQGRRIAKILEGGLKGEILWEDELEIKRKGKDESCNL